MAEQSVPPNCCAVGSTTAKTESEFLHLQEEKMFELGGGQSNSAPLLVRYHTWEE